MTFFVFVISVLEWLVLEWLAFPGVENIGEVLECNDDWTDERIT